MKLKETRIKYSTVSISEWDNDKIKNYKGLISVNFARKMYGNREVLDAINYDDLQYTAIKIGVKQ